MSENQRELNAIWYNAELAEKVINAGNYRHAIGYHQNIINMLENLARKQEKDKSIESGHKVLNLFAELEEREARNVLKELWCRHGQD